MSTLTELIRNNKQRPIRRCYIKRRNEDGTYETNWIRIDNWKNRDRVLNWGSISIEINNNPAEILDFNASSLSMTFSNADGNFNVEDSTSSIWFGYLNRKYTKLKIDLGYKDTDDSEVGVASVFEGFINSVKLSPSGTAQISILSYQTILNKYDIKDLGLTSSERTVEQLLASILNQAKITEYIPYVAPTPTLSGIIITDPSLLEGTYWDNIKYFAQITNSIPLLVGSTFSFIPREAEESSSWDFKGFGADDEPDIYEITSYDDEGADNVRLRFQEEGGTLKAVSSNSVLLRKYIGLTGSGADVEFVNLDNVKSTDKQSVLNELVDYWQYPRPPIDFETRMMINFIKPTSKITLEIRQGVTNKDKIIIWGAWNWGDGSVWGEYIGGINIVSSEEWIVTKVVKNINDWYCMIKAEKIPVT